MPHSLLIIDSHEQHRRIVRHFMEKIRPMDQLYEYDPSELGTPDDDFDWSEYDLIIMDTELGNNDGLELHEKFRHQPGFPPVIFLSSGSSAHSRSETDMVITAMRQGVKDFLFKQHLKARQLHESIGNILGISEIISKTEKCEKKRPSHDKVGKEKTDGGHKKTDVRDLVSETIDSLSGKEKVKKRQDETKKAVITKTSLKEQPHYTPTPVDVEQTLNEISMAMVMLEARTKWPFTIEDILASNAKIDQYKILSYRGKGHCGISFRARNMETDELVYINMITHIQHGSSKIYKQFTEEFSRMKEWNHPNLARLYEHKMIGDTVFTVHENLNSIDLSQKIKKGLSEGESIDYFLQILYGFQFLHEHNVIAGYLTPHHILFRDDKTPVLTNFGLLQKLQSASQMTGETTIGDIPFYVSPERIQGRQADYRGDLYLAGVFLYEMLSGHPPYHLGSTQDILYAHATEPTPLLPDKKHPMNRIIKGLMEKVPSKRYKTAEATCDEVKRVWERMNQ